MPDKQKPVSKLALKIGIAGLIGFGAIATGLFVTRKGRHLVREAWEGRERTRVEDRVLDALWDNDRLARRRIDVDEVAAGTVELQGTVRTDEERELAVHIAAGVKGVASVLDALEVVPRPMKTRRT